jgi:hypothetical protein
LSSEEIYLKPPIAGVAEAVKPEDAAEIAWSFLKATGDIATLTRFTDRFPTSRHVTESRERIASLQALPIASADDPGAVYKLTNYVQAADAGFEDAEIAVAKRFTRNNPAIEEAWNFVKDTIDHKLIRRFVEQFPTKKRRIDADVRVAALGQAPIVRAAVPRRPLPRVEPDEYVKAARDPAVVECYTLGNQNDPSCRLAVARYPEIARFPESLEFIQNFCVAVGRNSGCVSTVKSDWNFPGTRNSPTAGNPAGGGVPDAGSIQSDKTQENIQSDKTQENIQFDKTQQNIQSDKTQENIQFDKTQQNIQFDKTQQNIQFDKTQQNIQFDKTQQNIQFDKTQQNIQFDKTQRNIQFDKTNGAPAPHRDGLAVAKDRSGGKFELTTHVKHNFTAINIAHKNIKTLETHAATDVKLPKTTLQSHNTADTKLATTTLHTTANVRTTHITTDVKTPHVTTDVKLPKVTQNVPSVKVPSVTPTVHTPTVNVKVNVRVPNVQVHLPH